MTEESRECIIAGAILAGGNAERLGGITKGALEVAGGVSIVERLIIELGNTGIDDIVIIANEKSLYQSYGVEVIPDLREPIGPIGGIETALTYFANRSNAVMFVPCDLPQITANEMSALKKAFVESKAPAVFAARDDFFWHPLCAVVHNDLIKDISAAIDRGERSIRKVFQHLEAAGVRFADDSAFFNINSLANLHEWLNKCKTEK